MPDKTISSLPDAASVDSNAVVAADNAAGTLTEKVTLGQIAGLVSDQSLKMTDSVTFFTVYLGDGISFPDLTLQTTATAMISGSGVNSVIPRVGSSYASGSGGAVSGGEYHSASGNYSVVSGGFASSAGGTYATVCGGEINLASGYCGVVCGGRLNVANGDMASILGGENNSTNFNTNAHIIGSNITADAPDTAFVNNLKIVGGGLRISSIPTSDPGVPGAVWSDGGTLKISP